MQINLEGLKLLKDFEGCKLKVYADLVGLPTVGYGHMDPVLKIGDTITQERADELLAHDIVKYEQGVNKALTRPISDNQFSALVCFAYNVGIANLNHSTLLKRVNSGEFSIAADEFLKWSHAGGKAVAGLLRRRKAERALFLA